MLKYLLGRKVRFHDLAFFDPVIYESLRQLVLDAEKKETSAQLFAALELTFSIDLSPEEAGTCAASPGVPANVELVSHGRDLEVNSHNVYAYVRKYSTYRSVKQFLPNSWVFLGNCSTFQLDKPIIFMTVIFLSDFQVFS